MENRKRILSALLLSLFLFYYGSNTLFWHKHLIGEGSSITHSHPYSGTPDKPDHDHTATQLLLIAQLAAIGIVLAAVPARIRRTDILTASFLIPLSPKIDSVQLRPASSRAPPAVL